MIFQVGGHLHPSQHLSPWGWQFFTILFCSLMLLAGVTLIVLSFVLEDVQDPGMVRRSGGFLFLMSVIGFAGIHWVRRRLS